MSEETKNLNHTDQKKGEDALKGLSMKERKKALEEKKEKRRTKIYIAIGVVVAHPGGRPALLRRRHPPALHDRPHRRGQDLQCR